MATRERPQQRSSAAGHGASRASAGAVLPHDAGASAALLARFRALVDEAVTAEPARRRALSLEINAVLRQLRRPGDEATKTARLWSTLNSRALDELVDESGESCRKVAVQTVLSFGSPHADRVSANDLAFAQSDTAPAIASEPGSQAYADEAARARRAAVWVMGLCAVVNPAVLYAGDQLLTAAGLLSTLVGAAATGVFGLLAWAGAQRISVFVYLLSLVPVLGAALYPMAAVKELGATAAIGVAFAALLGVSHAMDLSND